MLDRQQQQLPFGLDVVLHEPDGHPRFGGDLPEPGGVQSLPYGHPDESVGDRPPPFVVVHPLRHAHPFSTRDVETTHGTTHVHLAGTPCEEVPVVLLHGASSNAAQWYPFVSGLSRHRWLIAPDTPGDPGRSTAAAIHAPATSAAWLTGLLDGLGVQRAHLVGHSYGGWLALNCAQRAPARVASATLLDPGGLERVSGRFLALVLLNGFAGLAPTPWRRRLAKRLDNPVLVVDELRRMLLTAARTFRSDRPAPLPLTDADLLSIQVPVLALLGARSPLLHPARAAARVRSIPHGRAVVLPNVGHGPGFEADSDVVPRIVEFWASL